MTREEAIKELSYIIDEMPSMECADWIEAISMGIKALNQEPCADAISRQAVLEIAKSSKSNWIDNSVLFKRVNELPPVTPAEKVGRWISNAEDDLKISEYTCSNCKGLSDEDSDFCPKCGSYNGGTQHD